MKKEGVKARRNWCVRVCESKGGGKKRKMEQDNGRERERNRIPKGNEMKR